ncbi:MAG: hypothetical protein JWR15_3573 [Prosthecobacter sp.]|nr:hypothetical protein [Prosthecobacter sp.]
MAALIQILLPLCDNEHQPLPEALHAQVKQELTEKFGGMTAYVHSPAEGHWQGSGTEQHDDMVMYEVMTPMVNGGWWADYRRELEARFRQEEVMIRAMTIQRL